MAIHLTQSEIIERFGEDAKCRISYKGQKKIVKGKLHHVNWKQCVALTVLFDSLHYYNIDGDACERDGVRIVVKQKSTRK